VTLFGPPEGRAADLLSRWIWRGAVVGAAPQGNTVAIRRNAGAVYDDPVASADRLLALLPAGGERWEPDLSQTRLNSAQAKLNVLALADQRPAVLVQPDNGETGTSVDVCSLASQALRRSSWSPSASMTGVPGYSFRVTYTASFSTAGRS